MNDRGTSSARRLGHGKPARSGPDNAEVGVRISANLPSCASGRTAPGLINIAAVADNSVTVRNAGKSATFRAKQVQFYPARLALTYGTSFPIQPPNLP